MAKKLYRSKTDSIIGGVAGGIAEYFEIDVVVVRLIWVLLAFAGAGVLAYIVAWIVIPLDPNQENKTKETASAAKQDSSESARLHNSRGREFLGFLFIALGAIILIQNFLPEWGLNKLWPVILIFFGLVVILRGVRRSDDR